MPTKNLTLPRFVLRSMLFILISFLLASCIEVKHEINLNKQGSGEARVEIAVQQEWADMIIPRLKRSIQEDPAGWNIIEERQEEGRHRIVLGKKFKSISDLNDDEFRYTLSEEGSFLKKSYILEVEQLESSDMPFSYELTIKMPGSIDETNGIKISSNRVRWNFDGFRKGRRMVVKSSALSLPSFNIYIAVAIAGFILILVMTKAFKRAGTPIAETSVSSKTVFCAQCGKENPASANFCTNCGQKL